MASTPIKFNKLFLVSNTKIEKKTQQQHTSEVVSLLETRTSEIFPLYKLFHIIQKHILSCILSSSRNETPYLMCLIFKILDQLMPIFLETCQLPNVMSSEVLHRWINMSSYLFLQNRKDQFSEDFLT